MLNDHPVFASFGSLNSRHCPHGQGASTLGFLFDRPNNRSLSCRTERGGNNHIQHDLAGLMLLVLNLEQIKMGCA